MYMSLTRNPILRNAGLLKIENEQHHFFEVHTFDHKDDGRPEKIRWCFLRSVWHIFEEYTKF